MQITPQLKRAPHDAGPACSGKEMDRSASERGRDPSLSGLEALADSEILLTGLAFLVEPAVGAAIGSAFLEPASTLCVDAVDDHLERQVAEFGILAPGQAAASSDGSHVVGAVAPGKVAATQEVRVALDQLLVRAD